MDSNVKTVLDLPEFKPYAARFAERTRRFNLYRRFVDGSVYKDVEFRVIHKLYAETKALFSFLSRAVNLDIALVPGIMQAWPLADGTSPAIEAAQKQLYEWSDWPITSDEWLEDGASLGEAMLKIVPSEAGEPYFNPVTRRFEQEPPTVKLDRIKPEICMLLDHFDPSTKAIVQMALIIDRNCRDNAGEQYEYAEAITPTQIRTYRNGEPHGYNGNPDRYANPLGFVPVLRTDNDSESRPTFSITLEQITSVNEFASYLGKVIARAIDTQWAAFGAEQRDIIKSGSNIWFFDQADARLEAVTAQIDIPGALAFIQEVKAETKSNLPELVFDDLRMKAQIATDTLDIQLTELHAKIYKMRRRYDHGLTRAHQMAARAAQMLGIPGIEALLEAHTLDESRPVRPVSEMEQIAIDNARMGRDMQRTLLAGDGMTGATNDPTNQRANRHVDVAPQPAQGGN